MVSYGDKVYVNDLGVEKTIHPADEKEQHIYLVEECDGSINWYINPNDREDKILISRGIDLTDKELEGLEGLPKKEQNRCMLKGCDGTLYFYEGLLGYEAFVCDKCGAHYTERAIYPNWDRKKQEE